MEKTYKKLNDNELEVTKIQPTPEPTKTVYEPDFLDSQIEQITKDRDSYVALRNAEIAECEEYKAEMLKQGIVKKEKIIN